MCSLPIISGRGCPICAGFIRPCPESLLPQYGVNSAHSSAHTRRQPCCWCDTLNCQQQVRRVEKLVKLIIFPIFTFWDTTTYIKESLGSCE